jgi:hypothetical protein
VEIARRERCEDPLRVESEVISMPPKVYLYELPEKLRAIRVLSDQLIQYASHLKICKSMELEDDDHSVYSAVEHEMRVNGMKVKIQYCVTVYFKEEEST